MGIAADVRTKLGKGGCPQIKEDGLNSSVTSGVRCRYLVGFRYATTRGGEFYTVGVLQGISAAEKGSPCSGSKKCDSRVEFYLAAQARTPSSLLQAAIK